jgi:hypothetical protein
MALPERVFVNVRCRHNVALTRQRMRATAVAVLLLAHATAARADEDDPFADARSTLGIGYPGAAASCEHRQYPQAECLAGHLLWGTCETQRDSRTQEDDPGACDFVCGFCLSPCPEDTALHLDHLERVVAGTDWAFDCQPCPAGTFDHDLDPFTECSGCAAGTYKEQGGEVCEPCDMYSIDDDLDAGTPCVLCPAGEKRISSVGCEPCPAGEYMASPLDPACSYCPAGSFSAGGETSCAPCPAGTADLDSDPSTPCQICPAGDHADRGQTECTACDNFPDYVLTDDDNNYITPKLCLPAIPPEPEPEFELPAAPPPSPPPAGNEPSTPSSPGDGVSEETAEPPDTDVRPEPEPEPEQELLAPEPEHELEPWANGTGTGDTADTEDEPEGTTGSLDQVDQVGSGSWEEQEQRQEEESDATADAATAGVLTVALVAGSLVCLSVAILLCRWRKRRQRASKVYAMSHGRSGSGKTTRTGKLLGQLGRGPSNDSEQSSGPSAGAGAAAASRTVMHLPSAGESGDPNDLLPAWMESGIDLQEEEEGPLPLIARLGSNSGTGGGGGSPTGRRGGGAGSPQSPGSGGGSGRGSPLAFLSQSFGRGSPTTPTSASPLSPHGIGLSRREQARLDREAAEARAREAEAYRKIIQGRRTAMALYGPQAAKMWTPGRKRKERRAARNQNPGGK